ncbi:SPOR domain-containing protein [uncultured Clostridium sp.]|uniref:SPOR domain-containing protein n=1 Tax=uncultured Clostridium sp. TaxID=59620 RepID=UPI0028E8A99E|nr:SPOR domain-containing protein [uncultured Clostridium sp.]
MIKIKYTRYDLKRKRKDKFFSFILLFLLILCLLLVIGFLFKTPLKESINSSIDGKKEEINITKGESEKEKEPKNAKEVNFVKGEVVKYAAVQGGMFKNEEYAKETKNKLSSFGNSFIVNEGELKRVILGVYSEEESKKVMDELTKNKIENSRLVFEIKYNDTCDFEIAQIANAYLQILNKLSEKNVKHIQTKQLKEWVNSLNDIDANSKNIDKLKEIKSKVNSLPEQISKDNLEENYIFVYNYLKKFN